MRPPAIPTWPVQIFSEREEVVARRLVVPLEVEEALWSLRWQAVAVVGESSAASEPAPA